MATRAYLVFRVLTWPVRMISRGVFSTGKTILSSAKKVFHPSRSVSIISDTVPMTSSAKESTTKTIVIDTQGNVVSEEAQSVAITKEDASIEQDRIFDPREMAREIAFRDAVKHLKRLNLPQADYDDALAKMNIVRDRGKV